ncbi:hypothetical protein DSO57_1013799 [Entomophthora muscae]|uniref:Uncharacterized protein n=1 Tax=Entomophthora muscae TaxID=34485 RepID=A0ACC2RWS0_9FUNG|nr:hypothetical protein DSO57_1013799 [Entomophthora muscae]
MPAFTPSPRVLDQEIIPAPEPHLSFPGVPLLCQLAQTSQTMSAATGELPLVLSASSYDYSKLRFAYLTMLGLTEQVIPHMGVWHPWATTANHVMCMAPIIYWAFQTRPFPLTESSPGSNLGHDNLSSNAHVASEASVGISSEKPPTNQYPHLTSFKKRHQFFKKKPFLKEAKPIWISCFLIFENKHLFAKNPPFPLCLTLVV